MLYDMVYEYFSTSQLLACGFYGDPLADETPIPIEPNTPRVYLEVKLGLWIDTWGHNLHKLGYNSSSYVNIAILIANDCGDSFLLTCGASIPDTVPRKLPGSFGVSQEVHGRAGSGANGERAAGFTSRCPTFASRC